MNLLEAFWSLRSTAELSGNAKYADKKLVAELELNEDVRRALKVLHDSNRVTLLKCDDRISVVENLPTVGTVYFEVDAPKAYFENLEELIVRHPFDPPEGYRVYNHCDEEELIPRYKDAIKLAKLLSKLALSSERSAWTLWAKDRLVISKSYTAQDLREINGIEEMRRKLEGDENLTSKEERMLDIYESLFVQAVNDVVSGIPIERRFAHLISHFSECIFRFKLAFRCFADEANDAIKRYEDSRAGMISALNGVLGNIQTALIGVPLAGLLALKEMKPASGMTYENGIITCAVLIVGALLLLLSISQGKALDAIRIQREQLEREVGGLGGKNQKIDELLTPMTKHHSVVKTLLYIVRAIIGIFMLIAMFAFLYRSGYASSEKQGLPLSEKFEAIPQGHNIQDPSKEEAR